MSFITLDFETYYAKGLGFKTQTTEEYVRDRRFEVIGVGVRIDEQPTTWFSGTKDEIKEHLMKIDWDDSALLCHNTLFDGCILAWHFGINPTFLFDTLCMARAIHGVDAGGSLKALAIRYGIGEKGDEVIHAEGKKRLDFSEEELQRYGDYCKNDVELTLKLFRILSSAFPYNELKLIDMTLRMFTQPLFHVDDALLQERLIDLQEEKMELLHTLMDRLQCKDEEEVRKKLASNKQFAAVLEGLGVEVPMKVSPRTGKDTYALAKNDEGFLALTEHEDEFVQHLCAVRLGTMSTLEESRPS
jgi:DNA polymerase